MAAFEAIADIRAVDQDTEMDHDRVHDQASFAEYLEGLREELGSGANWENTTLPDFLQAMEAWARDWNQPAEANPWRHAAEVITAATIYE
ncbi:DUF7660 family protein [Sphingomonas sp.]|uniref:DUF7660 family protein n=1 Tax=Sphingomonas sp. TaxID=28214 RepID=UPI002E0F63E2|nr:hypothetical protein [Sphingomonas sp.]